MAEIRLGIVQTMSRSTEKQQSSGENLSRSGPNGFSFLSAIQSSTGISKVVRHDSNAFPSIAKVFATDVQREFPIAGNSGVAFGDAIGST